MALNIAPSAVRSVSLQAGKTSGPQVHTFTSDAGGFDTHSYWIDTGKAVVVFDAQFTPQIAQQLLAQIRSQTKSPIQYVVVTHPNPDKFNGASVFQSAGAKLVTSEATAKAMAGVDAFKKSFFVSQGTFTKDNYPKLPVPDLTFKKGLELKVDGGLDVHLEELGHPGVSSNQTVAYVKQSGALFTGDLIHNQAHAWLEGGIVKGQPVPTLKSWERDLSELLKFKDATVYGGRGAPGPVGSSVRNEQAYLKRMDALVTDYVASLGPRRSELFGPQMKEHAEKLTQLAEKAFPGYGLGYMVQYSVYGLAQQKARELGR